MPINTRRDYVIVGSTALGSLIAGYLIGNVAPISRFYQPAQQPTAQVSSAKVSPLEQEVCGPVETIFNQPTEEHKRFLKGEIKYADLSDSVKAWFSLRHPQVEFKQEGNNYFVNVKPITTYKTQDLGEFKFGVKVGDKFYCGLKPNQVANIRADKSTYDALSGAHRPVAQVIMYRDLAKDGKKVRQVYASLNYEKKPVSVTKVEPVAPAEPKEEPKVEAPKAPVEAPVAAPQPAEIQKPEVVTKAPEKENLEQYLEPIDPKHLILPRL